ncbi:virulence protein SciE type [Catenovulum sp. SM1970]|uniref:type VI secretion system accessory protein TagJ n=1 Tax=Marinifaba aquimaris TaxID=2741323 RepID=UPI0015718890|nr:type VI secretion system accessory protein TagJ [Marinifaba aquimaris]NTS75653.1 virulence protein SciE type [Marinifaba aquimaris]
MNAESLLKQGDLEACQQQLFSEIRKDPSNVDLRIFLFQLSCITQDWKKAVNQLDVIKDMSDSAIPMVNTYQQLIECEQQRAAVFAGDKEPTCFGEPSEWLAYFVKAFQHAAKGEYEAAAGLINQGTEVAPELAGKINEQDSFNWITDGDLRFGPVVEVIVNGSYYWLPLENVTSIEFEPVEDLRDMVWRGAHVTLKNRGKLVVFLPVRYPITAQTNDSQKLSRSCEWVEPVENFFIGQGQRVFITDSNEHPMLNIEKLELN